MNGNVKIISIESIQEFLDAIKSIENLGVKKIWFRGIADESYGLEPSLYRKTDTPTIEKQLLNRFKSRSLPFIGNNNSHKSDWEWLFIMQHYGVPTRLLDWSESALLALAFAVIYREDKHKTKDASVWCLDPIKLNIDFLKGIKVDEPIPNITDESVKRVQVFNDEEIPVDFPIAVYGPLNSERIVAQKGVFTLFPFKEKFKLEDLDVAHEFLTKIIIPNASVDLIKSQLITLGITESNVYPGLDSIAKEINREILSS